MNNNYQNERNQFNWAIEIKNETGRSQTMNERNETAILDY